MASRMVPAADGWMDEWADGRPNDEHGSHPVDGFHFTVNNKHHTFL